MIENTVFLSEDATEDIGDISDFIVAVSRSSHAVQYTFEILSELKALSYIATMLPEPEYGYPKRFHPNAKMMKLHKKPLCAIFHIEDMNVIIDRIIHSSMITY